MSCYMGETPLENLERDIRRRTAVRYATPKEITKLAWEWAESRADFCSIEVLSPEVLQSFYIVCRPSHHISTSSVKAVEEKY